jgi:hypothetical protein
MRIGGLAMLVDRAVDRATSPAIQQRRRAIVLGALREDVGYVRGLSKPFEHLSLSHFWGPTRPGGFIPLWPSARTMADHYFARAVSLHREGAQAAGFVELGRVAHLLADMACPVHVHRVLHDGDGFEWFVESHLEELGGLPAEPVPAAARASDLITTMATFTSAFPADRTQHAVGRWLVRKKLARSLPQHEIRRAARAIIPVAIAHMSALLRLYEDAVNATPSSATR